MELLKSLINNANIVHETQYYLMNMNGVVLPVDTTLKKGINELTE